MVLDDATMSDTMTDQPPSGRPWSGLPRPISDLRRSADDRWIAGVCGGIAQRTHIDTWIVRLLAFLLTFTGLGVPLYVIAWLLVPTDTAPSVADTKRWNHTTVLAVCALVVIASLVAFGPADIAAPWRALPWVIVGVGVYLVLRADRDARPDQRDPIAPNATSPAPTTETGGPQVPQVPQVPLPPPPPPPRPPRARSLLTPLTLFGLLGLCGAAIIEGGRGWARPEVVAGIALTGIGAVLVASAFVGRARGLRFLGLLVAVPLLIAVAAGPRWRDWSNRTYRPTSLSQLHERYELGIGRSRFDLRDLTLASGDRVTVGIDQLIGQVVVWLPPNATTEVRANVAAGEITLGDDDDDDAAAGDRFGDDRFEDGGRRLHRSFVTGGGEGRVVLDIELGAGEIVIEHAAAAVTAPGTTAPAAPAPATSTPTTTTPTTTTTEGTPR